MLESGSLFCPGRVPALGRWRDGGARLLAVVRGVAVIAAYKVGPPNMRVQRTRSRSPLTRDPLGGQA
jgi:hypothetical protein